MPGIRGIALAFALLIARPVGAEDAKTPPSRLLDHYLHAQVATLLEARRAAVAALKTPEQVHERQAALRTFFLRSLGEFPERTPLDAKVVGTIARQGYRVERVIFESRPKHHVTALCYIPAGRGRFPGVLMPCGHAGNAKAYEQYQQASAMLALAGSVVLCYDPIGQGERLQMLDRTGKPLVQGTDEHTLAGIGALLVGRQLASYRIWDGTRALDYLASRPEVDPARLGCTGNSGGGTVTAYLMALDDRVVAAAPGCYITSLERLFATIGPQDAEQNISGQVAAGMNHADYLTMHAPKPTLITVGTRDFFDIDGSWQTFREAKLVFGRLGFGERVDLFESDEGHGFTRPRRIATARFMRRWLGRIDDAFDAPDIVPIADSLLQCTRSGQVMREFDDVSVFELSARHGRALAADRAIPRSAGEFRARVRSLIGLGDWRPTAITPRIESDPETVGAAKVRKMVFEVEPGLLIPVVEIVRGSGGRARIKIAANLMDELAAKPAAENSRTVLVDVRGMGTTAPEPDRGGKSLLGNDWKEAFLSFHIARPLVGQRVRDVLTVAYSLEGSPAVELEGVGAGGIIALHAALIDEGGVVKGVTVRDTLVSWTDLLERGLSRGQLASVVPDALSVYDLPDLAARLVPLPLTIRAPKDALGEPLKPGVFEQAYEPCRKAYEGTQGLVLEP